MVTTGQRAFCHINPHRSPSITIWLFVPCQRCRKTVHVHLLGSHAVNLTKLQEFYDIFQDHVCQSQCECHQFMAMPPISHTITLRHVSKHVRRHESSQVRLYFQRIKLLVDELDLGAHALTKPKAMCQIPAPFWN